MRQDPLDYLAQSFELHLRAENKASKTIVVYLAALRNFTGWMSSTASDVDDWSDVTRTHLRAWSASMIELTTPGNASVQWRGLQQFLRWATGEGEITQNPMSGLKGPQVKAPLVPILEEQHLAMLLSTVSGTGFAERRDNAIIRLLIDTGIRRGEIVGINVRDLNLLDREVVVTGKGGKSRIVRFGSKTAKALDRYLRMRSRRPDADSRQLWLSSREHSPITYHGIRMIIRRRTAQAGLEHVYLHRFRHTFAHMWLDQGGAEGDLMELTGWTSRQMLTRYGASARSARARRSYDRVTLGDQF